MNKYTWWAIGTVAVAAIIMGAMFFTGGSLGTVSSLLRTQLSGGTLGSPLPPSSLQGNIPNYIPPPGLAPDGTTPGTVSSGVCEVYSTDEGQAIDDVNRCLEGQLQTCTTLGGVFSVDYNSDVSEVLAAQSYQKLAQLPPTGDCSDDLDNDGDTLFDEDDPDCTNGQGVETIPNTCADGIDNDGDGLIDDRSVFGFLADPECFDRFSSQETINNASVADPAANPQCSNGLDDDGDGFTDFPSDPDCSDHAGAEEGSSAPDEGPLADAIANLQCLNRRDDDGDGHIDRDDPGCTSPFDDDESDDPLPTLTHINASWSCAVTTAPIAGPPQGYESLACTRDADCANITTRVCTDDSNFIDIGYSRCHPTAGICTGEYQVLSGQCALNAEVCQQLAPFPIREGSCLDLFGPPTTSPSI